MSSELSPPDLTDHDKAVLAWERFRETLPLSDEKPRAPKPEGH